MNEDDAGFTAGATRYKLYVLQDSAEILIDRWGVAHIYASSSDDAFFAQGFNAARDRLWQIDLWRRRGLGLLSEVFGPSFVKKDRAARLFLYRGDMHSEWLAYGSDTKRIVTAFVSGINEYIRLTEEDPGLLPEEFRMRDYKPARWRAEDVARIRTHGLYKNLSSEVERALTLREFGPEVEALRQTLDPPHATSIPDGLDLSVITRDVLRVYELATTPVEFSETPAVSARNLEGSNNWVVSAKRTATGRPILANDPHRTQSVPSLRYIVHLSAPEMDVIGAGEPVLPGISIGHNGKIAFGLTIFSIDQEDLYVYETNPDNPSEYLYEGRWEPMRIETRRISVKGEDPVEVVLKYTRHGPVIHEDPEQRAAFALRAAWLEPGMAPYLGNVEYMRAQNRDEFLAAMNRWGAPGENQIYADTDGNIGWKPAGLVPKRPNWDGLLPVPGDGRYEWDGFLDMDELPVEFNPSRGWISTANQMNLPADYPHADKGVSFEWYAPVRHERITEVLRENTNVTLQDSLRLQSDYLSITARRITDLLKKMSSSNPKVQQALRMFKKWDHVLSVDSTPAALFEVWFRLYLRPELYRRAVASSVPPDRLTEAVAAVMPLEDQAGDTRIDLAIIGNPERWFGPDVERALHEAMLTSLQRAVEYLEKLFGSDPNKWAWGNLHSAYLVHPLSPLADNETRERLNIGPVSRGGSGDTVGNSAYRIEDFRQTGGASFRVVMDVGEWDNSLAMNFPGQSGDSQNPHYADLVTEWARDAAFPLLYTKEKIEASTDCKVFLEPAE